MELAFGLLDQGIASLYVPQVLSFRALDVSREPPPSTGGHNGSPPATQNDQDQLCVASDFRRDAKIGLGVVRGREARMATKRYSPMLLSPEAVVRANTRAPSRIRTCDELLTRQTLLPD